MEILNALVLLANFVLIPAVSYGSQLALGALGVTLIYGILRFSNFAHGDTMAFGAMFTILFTWLFQSLGISIAPLPTALIALPFSIIICIGFVLGTDRLVYRFYRKKKASPVIYLIASMGVMFITNGVIRFIIGPNDQKFQDGERFIIKARTFKQITGLSEGLTIKVSQGITVFVTIVAVVVLFWFLNKTRTGKSMRAYSDNEDLALLSGINPDKVVMVAWIICAILATIAGGFVIAFSEIMVTYAYKKFHKYLVPESWEPDTLVQLLSTDYKFAVSFLILLLVLLFRPSGIFAGKSI